MRRNFGGCAGNIAYNLRLLGGAGLIMATVGHDFAPYASWLGERGIALTHVRVVPEEFTAQAFITTDLDDNQITAFHPGAMNHAHLNHVAAAPGVRLGIVAPDGRRGMLEHAAQFAAAGIPTCSILGRACRCSTARSCGRWSARQPGSPSTTTRAACWRNVPDGR
jgi:adenosine kinase